jgi:4-diphosphocytidyl-2-C-methyl-D-erythritol kinase
MEIRAPAKINLRHRVFERDDAGFYGVETILARTNLTDIIGLEETGAGISIEVDGPFAEGVPNGPDNLCWQAAELFLDQAFRRKKRPGLRFTLMKQIPHGSGLGGGSADAAATLRLLARRWNQLSERELLLIAGKLGSDVPFAMLEVPMALGWERGRRLLPLRAPPARPALVLCSRVHVSTPDAYSWLRDARACESSDAPGTMLSQGSAALPGATRLAQWESLERLVINDLEGPVISRYPDLARGVNELRKCEVSCSGMTGSGSALFGIFPDENACANARTHIESNSLVVEHGWSVLEVRLPT